MSSNAAKKDHSPSRSVQEHASAKRAAPTSVQSGPVPVNDKEAQLTGAGREELQRLLKDNYEKGKAMPHPDVPAGQHATGSFTGENKNKKK